MSDIFNSQKNIFFCPIPNEQLPINLFIEKRDKNLLKDYSKDKKYILTNFYFLAVFLFILLLSINDISKIYFQVEFVFLLLILLDTSSFYLIKELKKSLNEANIIYEESSWFNAEKWEKPKTIFRKDKFLFNEKVLYSSKYFLKKILIELIIIFSLFFFWKEKIIS